MSAQRRTASKRTATATPRRAPANGPRPAPAAAAPAPAAPAAPVAPPKPGATPGGRPVAGSGGQPPTSGRPPKPAAVERVRTAPAEPGRFAGRLDGLRRLYRDTLAEMKKINWPDRETTKNLTIVVIGISAALGILLGGIDFLLQSVFEAL
jgi:preprotein translocase subunit SecE